MKNKKLVIVIILIVLFVIAIFFYKANQKKIDTDNLTPKEYIEKNN